MGVSSTPFNKIKAVTLGGNTSGALALVSTGTLHLAGGNNITLSQNGQSVTVSAFNQSVQTQMTGLTAGLSNIGNTSGDTGLVSNRLVFAGGNNVTLSGSTNGQSATITISAAAGGGALSAGLSNIGNTSGDTGLASQQLVFAGGNNITLSGSTNGGSMTVSISAPNLGAGNAFSAGISTQGNTAGTTGLVSQQIQFVGTNDIVLSQSVNGNSATLSVGRSAPTLQAWLRGIASVNVIQVTNGSQYVFPLDRHFNPFQGDMTVNTMGVFLSWNLTATSVSQQLSSSIFVGLYTLTGSTLSLLNSASATFGNPTANNSNTSRWHGKRMVTVASGDWSSQPVLKAGSVYWMGLQFSTHVTVGTTASLMACGSGVDTNFSNVHGQATNNSQRPYGPFYGMQNATTNAVPSSLTQNNVISQTGFFQILDPAIVFNNLFIT